MEASPSAMLKLLLPKTPYILKTALLHSLYLSDTSSKWDLRTELTIKILRQMLGPESKPSSITQQQRFTTKDPGVKGKVWVSKVKFPIPEEDDLREMLFKAIEDMKGEELKEMVYTKPDARPLEAEWNGHRAGVSDHKPEPAGLQEKDKYQKLMAETSSKVTILYFHGGAMFLLDPSTYRANTSKLAKATGGRVFSVRYRLAPQNPFPAALLDALTAYLTLLHPPPGSQHDAVPAESIVFSGDSAGGTLCAALLQLLLQLRRTAPVSTSPDQPWAGDPTLRFHGRDVAVPLPAGVALTSPWLDITRSLPSIEGLTKYDYLPPPSQIIPSQTPPCKAWPADPPRADMYCEGSALLHPLVSPLAAPDWRGAPPVFFSLGQEMLRDEDAVLARRMAGQDVRVVWREFEAMPHVFAYMLEEHKASRVHFEDVAKFCKDAVEVRNVTASAEFVVAKSLVRREVGFEALTDLSDEQVVEAMRKGKERIERRAGDVSREVRHML